MYYYSYESVSSGNHEVGWQDILVIMVTILVCVILSPSSSFLLFLLHGLHKHQNLCNIVS